MRTINADPIFALDIRTNDRWIAKFEDDNLVWGEGDTKAEAILDLLERSGEFTINAPND